VADVAGWFAGFVVSWVVVGAVGGAVGGAAQWLVLRSGWWVLASALAWAVGHSVSKFMVANRLDAFGDMNWDRYWVLAGVVNWYWDLGWAWDVTWAVAGAACGAITGVALVLLLRRPIEEGSEAEA
jgi:hypothetical protein